LSGSAHRILNNVAIWPIWDADGGLVEEEATEITEIVQQGRRARITAGVVLRPVSDEGEATAVETAHALVSTIGVDGPALWKGIAALGRFLSSKIMAGEH
jgi:hypothetical protein